MHLVGFIIKKVVMMWLYQKTRTDMNRKQESLSQDMMSQLCRDLCGKAVGCLFNKMGFIIFTAEYSEPKHMKCQIAV